MLPSFITPDQKKNHRPFAETMVDICQNFKFCYLSNDAFEVAEKDASIKDVSPPKIR